jgi:hypothetical protein
MGNPNGQEIIPITDFRKQRFMEWLCTPQGKREPSTMEVLSQELGLTRRTLSNWKKDDEFLEHWEKMYRRTVGSPERLQKVYDTLFQTATDPDDPKHVQAADKYIHAVEGAQPQKVDVTVTGDSDLSNLSDDDLFALLANRATKEVERRQGQADEIESAS